MADDAPKFADKVQALKEASPEAPEATVTTGEALVIAGPEGGETMSEAADAYDAQAHESFWKRVMAANEKLDNGITPEALEALKQASSSAAADSEEMAKTAAAIREEMSRRIAGGK